MTLSTVVGCIALVLLALRWLGAWAAPRRTHRARVWREEERSRLAQGGVEPQRALRPAGWLHWAGRRRPRAGPATGPSVSELLAPHKTGLLWEPYERTDPAGASRTWRRVVWAYVGVFLGITVMGIGLALTPIRSIGLLIGMVVAVSAIAWAQRIRAGLEAEHSRKRFDLVRDDRRAPALLLRPFGFEGQAFPSRRPFGLAAHRPMPVEEAMALAVGAAAPILAVGRPGDRLPRGSAVRLYADDEHWQSLVRDLVGHARWLVLRAGETAGVRWEIEEIIRQGRLDRCVIVMIDWEGYPFGEEHYARFAAKLAEWTGIALPAAGWNSWLLAFDAQGHPRLSGSQRPWRGEHEFVPMLRAQLLEG